MTTKKTKKAIETMPYKASIKVLGKVYKSEGETVSEALNKLTPQNCKGVGILSVEHGKNKKEKVLVSVQMSRLFNSHGLIKEVATKNVALLFEGI